MGAWGVVSGCSQPSFSCEDASACMQGSDVGFCEPNGYCSFPDEACPSGRRYGKHAVTGLAGMCVPMAGTTGFATDDGALDSTTDGGDDDDPRGSTSHAQGTTEDEATTTSNTVDATSFEEGTTTTAVQPFELDIPAAIAECTDPVQLDPAACAAADGPTSLNVDAEDSDFANQPTSSWLRFDLPDEVTSGLVTSVTLRVVVTTATNAHGPDAGEIWAVAPFEPRSLTQAQPSSVERLAESFGPVTQGETIEWSLPVTVVQTTPVYLGILAVNTDGVNYWNNDGVVPPVLHVEGH